MRVLYLTVLCPVLAGCLDDGLVPPGGDCPSGTVWVDGECLAECDPPCGPGQTCNHETGVCEEGGSVDGGTDGESDAIDGVDTGADGAPDVPWDGEGDPPADGTGDVPGDGADGGDGSCEAPRMICGTTCIDPRTDAMNCGGCDSVCTGGMGCVAGVCECTGPGEVRCDGVCIDVRSDPLNCGGCGVACDANGPDCTAGTCMCGADPACAPCDLTTCGACETCCPREGCRPMDAGNCGGCGLDCAPFDQCGQYDETGTCTFVCEDAFDPSRHYTGLFDVSPEPPSTTCVSSPGYDINRLHFTIPSGNLSVRGMPYVLWQMPKPTTADFVVTGISGCNEVTLTGHFRNADVFEGTWEIAVVHGCLGCTTETLYITGTRHSATP